MKLSMGVVKEGTFSHLTRSLGDDPLKKLLEAYNVDEFHSVFKNRYTQQGLLKQGLKGTNKILSNGWFKFKVSSEFDVSGLISKLQTQLHVIHALRESPILLRPDIAPSDTQYTSQWHLNNPTNPNFDIDAEAAWNINRGRNDVIIAVLDGGVDYNHPDLDPGDRSRVIQGTDTGEGDNDPLDDLPFNDPDSYAGHGTNIAGVIGARTDNGQLVAGVMWNCKIMPVKMVREGSVKFPFIDDWEWTTTAFPSDVADALDYAVNNGAHVINLSYSFPSMGWVASEVALRVPLIRDALENAYQNNVVITASMGNEFNSNNDVRYPAGFNDQVIAVGATNPNGTKAGFANTGPHIDLTAPGTGIVTTKRGGGTDTKNGTSFSSPIVAGVAGLVISQAKDRGVRHYQ